MQQKSTIVLVDDEQNILKSLRAAMEAEGYKVRTYSDGMAALEALTEEPADLGVFDIKMPRMDGMELLRRVRQQSDMPVIPPPSQRQQQAPQPPQAQGPSPRSASIEDLARMGYDVKAIERAGQAEGRYVVMMQRAGDVKTCLMRIEVQRGAPPQRQSACF